MAESAIEWTGWVLTIAVHLCSECHGKAHRRGKRNKN